MPLAGLSQRAPCHADSAHVESFIGRGEKESAKQPERERKRERGREGEGGAEPTIKGGLEHIQAGCAKGNGTL